MPISLTKDKKSRMSHLIKLQPARHFNGIIRKLSWNFYMACFALVFQFSLSQIERPSGDPQKHWTGSFSTYCLADIQSVNERQKSEV